MVPSSSRRRSKWRWLAACFWMTKRSEPFGGAGGAASPEGSAVYEKSRLRRYSARRRRGPAASAERPLVFAMCRRRQAVFFFLARAGLAAFEAAPARLRLAEPDDRLPCSRLAWR